MPSEVGIVVYYYYYYSEEQRGPSGFFGRNMYQIYTILICNSLRHFLIKITKLHYQYELTLRICSFSPQNAATITSTSAIWNGIRRSLPIT